VIRFVCFLFEPSQLVPEWGRVYDGEWVDKLARAIRRNYDGPHEVVAMVDRDDYAITEDVIQLRLDASAGGWDYMMQAWRPDVADVTTCVLGLDTIIRGDITEIVDHGAAHGLALPCDPYQVRTVCNAIGFYSSGQAATLWDEWGERREYWMHAARTNGRFSEMHFLRAMCSHAWRIDEGFPGQLVSYKKQWKKGNYPDARIVYFHGVPKMNAINDPQLLEHWI